MRRREFLEKTGRGVVGTCLAGCLVSSCKRKTDLPNIVIILADDMGFGDPFCYNDLSKIPTPHLDRLASEGVRFTDAHSPSAVCSPTRYGLLTGRYAWRTELKKSVLWPWDRPLIEPGRLTLPAMLKEHGYYTACIGKWHLGWKWPSHGDTRINDQVPVGQYDQQIRTEFGENIDYSGPIGEGPTTRGFDEYFGDDVPNFPPYAFIEDDRLLSQPIADKPPAMFGHDGSMAPGWRLGWVMPSLTDRALRFIRERASDSRPFFLYFSLTAPHTPIVPDLSFQGKSQAGLYGDYVHQVDWSVGQIIKELAVHDLRSNTLIIFTSDNGSPQRDGTGMSGPVGSVKERFGHDPSRPWRGMKGDIWEGGHRVPFIARWLGQIRPGSINPSLICLTDLMSTMARLVGHELPDDSAEDSFDMLSVLKGRKAGETSRRSVVLHSNEGIFAIREGAWKLILGRSSGGFTRYDPPEEAPLGQLYNLVDDPTEQNNLYLNRPEVVQRLVSLLGRFQDEGRSVPL